jgi:RimJ/RimL family protein N-acetyltransferase
MDGSPSAVLTAVPNPALSTARFVLRRWRPADAPAALEVYGRSKSAFWSGAATSRVTDLAAMRSLLDRWDAEAGSQVAPAGRWAVERRGDGLVIGGASVLPLPPGNHDLELGWQLDSAECGVDDVREVAWALAGWAFSHSVDEVFIVSPSGSGRTAAVAVRSGMQWVGETTKYRGLDLQVFRLRPSDLAVAETV